MYRPARADRGDYGDLLVCVDGNQPGEGGVMSVEFYFSHYILLDLFVLCCVVFCFVFVLVCREWRKPSDQLAMAPVELRYTASSLICYVYTYMIYIPRGIRCIVLEVKELKRYMSLLCMLCFYKYMLYDS